MMTLNPCPHGRGKAVCPHCNRKPAEEGRTTGVDASYAAMIEKTSMADTRDNRLAYGMGYALGKYDALHAPGDLISLLWDAHQDLGDWLRYATAARTGEEKRPPSENGSRASMAIRIRLSEAAIALREASPPQRWYVQAAFEKRIPGRTLFSVTDAEGQDYPKNQGVIDEARASLSSLPQEGAAGEGGNRG